MLFMRPIALVMLVAVFFSSLGVPYARAQVGQEVADALGADPTAQKPITKTRVSRVFPDASTFITRVVNDTSIQLTQSNIETIAGEVYGTPPAQVRTMVGDAVRKSVRSTVATRIEQLMKLSPKTTITDLKDYAAEEGVKAARRLTEKLATAPLNKTQLIASSKSQASDFWYEHLLPKSPPAQQQPDVVVEETRALRQKEIGKIIQEIFSPTYKGTPEQFQARLDEVVLKLQQFKNLGGTLPELGSMMEQGITQFQQSKVKFDGAQQNVFKTTSSQLKVRYASAARSWYSVISRQEKILRAVLEQFLKAGGDIKTAKSWSRILGAATTRIRVDPQVQGITVNQGETSLKFLGEDTKKRVAQDSGPPQNREYTPLEAEEHNRQVQRSHERYTARDQVQQELRVQYGEKVAQEVADHALQNTEDADGIFKNVEESYRAAQQNFDAAEQQLKSAQEVYRRTGGGRATLNKAVKNFDKAAKEYQGAGEQLARARAEADISLRTRAQTILKEVLAKQPKPISPWRAWLAKVQNTMRSLLTFKFGGSGVKEALYEPLMPRVGTPPVTSGRFFATGAKGVGIMLLFTLASNTGINWSLYGKEGLDASVQQGYHMLTTLEGWKGLGEGALIFGAVQYGGQGLLSLAGVTGVSIGSILLAPAFVYAFGDAAIAKVERETKSQELALEGKMMEQFLGRQLKGGAPVTPPDIDTIKQVSVSGVSDQGATISWFASALTRFTTQGVMYRSVDGEGMNFASSTTESSSIGIDGFAVYHQVVLNNLVPQREYRFTIQLQDTTGMIWETTEGSFMTRSISNLVVLAKVFGEAHGVNGFLYQEEVKIPLQGSSVRRALGETLLAMSQEQIERKHGLWGFRTTKVEPKFPISDFYNPRDGALKLPFLLSVQGSPYVKAVRARAAALWEEEAPLIRKEIEHQQLQGAEHSVTRNREAAQEVGMVIFCSLAMPDASDALREGLKDNPVMDAVVTSEEAAEILSKKAAILLQGKAMRTEDCGASEHTEASEQTTACNEALWQEFLALPTDNARDAFWEQQRISQLEALAACIIEQGTGTPQWKTYLQRFSAQQEEINKRIFELNK